MERRKASDFPPEVLKLFDGYVHGWLSRRDFLDKAGKYAVGGFSAAAMLESLRPNYALAQQVAKNDSRIATEYLTYPSPQGSGTMKGYFARPAGTGKWPGVVVIHENRGLNPYIEDVARRLAVDGFVAFAPDALTPLGGYPGDEDKARADVRHARRRQAHRGPDGRRRVPQVASRMHRQDRRGRILLRRRRRQSDRRALSGPRGGGAVLRRAGERRRRGEDQGAAPAPLRRNDERINAGWPAYEAALKANNVKYQAFIYPNTQHGFHNDTTPRYDEAAAKLAWSRTLAFFKENLKG